MTMPVLIFIKGNASFLMNGGTIENCSAGNYGVR